MIEFGSIILNRGTTTLMMKTMTMARLIVILLISWDRQPVPRQQRDGDGGVDFGYVFTSGGYCRRGNSDRLGDRHGDDGLVDGAMEAAATTLATSLRRGGTVAVAIAIALATTARSRCS